MDIPACKHNIPDLCLGVFQDFDMQNHLESVLVKAPSLKQDRAAIQDIVVACHEVVSNIQITAIVSCIGASKKENSKNLVSLLLGLWSCDNLAREKSVECHAIVYDLHGHMAWYIIGTKEGV